MEQQSISATENERCGKLANPAGHSNLSAPGRIENEAMIKVVDTIARWTEHAIA